MNEELAIDEFRSFSDIIRLNSPCTITEKIHGTNAQILIYETVELLGGMDGAHYGKKITKAKAGSRTRWITSEDDNFGFAAFVQKNEKELIEKLGLGRHYGEWYGSGINSGYNMKNGERKFALFNQKFAGKELPPGVEVVPILYSGAWRDGLVEEVMKNLKEAGSKAAPGFNKPEGIVLRFDRNGTLFKQVFEAEETGWAGKPKEKNKNPGPEVDRSAVFALMQPIRLEKLLSRDERYQREYPDTLPQIAKDYIADLEKEKQFEGVAEDVVKMAKKTVFPWIKDFMKERGFAT